MLFRLGSLPGCAHVVARGPTRTWFEERIQALGFDANVVHGVGLFRGNLKSTFAPKVEHNNVLRGSNCTMSRIDRVSSLLARNSLRCSNSKADTVAFVAGAVAFIADAVIGLAAGAKTSTADAKFQRPVHNFKGWCHNFRSRCRNSNRNRCAVGFAAGA